MFSNLKQKVQISKSEIGTRFEETEHLNVRLISVHTVHRKDTQNTKQPLSHILALHIFPNGIRKFLAQPIVTAFQYNEVETTKKLVDYRKLSPF